MASPPRSKVRKIPAKETYERIECELAAYQRGFLVLEIAIEYILCEINTLDQSNRQRIPNWIVRCLDMAANEAQEAIAADAHPVDLVEKIFCERCHTFLSEASEQAGYCIKCERS